MSKRNNLQDLINRANKVHNNKYDYSLIKNYISMNDYQEIICPKHGIFKIPLHWHINKGRGCKQCALDDRTDTRDEFIEKANNVHNKKYDYSKVEYKTSRIPVEIICSKHGSFFQLPNWHLYRKAGCPICKESKGERFISNFLEKINIKFKPQKSFFDLKHKSSLYYDFYLTDLNMCIEFDGEQHFKPVMIWGGEESFKILQERDRLKNEYCVNNKIPLLRLSYKDNDNEIKSKILKFLNLKESRLVTKFSAFI